jgi:hypothetical protein
MSRPVIRDWLYRSGDIFLPREYVDMLDTYIFNTRYVYMNVWSLLHGLSGVLFAFVFRRATLTHWILVHTLWELWQVFIGMTPLTVRGLLDTVLDTVMSILGFLAAKKIGVQKQDV